jgi:GTP-binding protein YchF
MKLGIIGLPQSGRTTIFAALTGARGEKDSRRADRADQRMGMVKVADGRVDLLTEIYRPKKTTYARVEYLLPSETGGGDPARMENAAWNQVRACDALIHVVRNFPSPAGLAPTPEEDFWRLEEDMLLNDLIVAEKRLERIKADRQKGKEADAEQTSLLESCLEELEKNRPLRLTPSLARAPQLKGFTFLSAKPQLLIANNDDEDESSPPWMRRPEGLDIMAVRGRLEREILGLAPEESEEFQSAYHIEESALDRVIKASHALLDLLSFFTVLNDEVRAWTVTRGSSALEAAGAVHTDMRRGFIRAEVLAFEHLKASGSFQEARKAGNVRLEGKEYIVRDGDIINFRFNV